MLYLPLQDPRDHVQDCKTADDRLGGVAEYSGRSSDSPYPSPFPEGMPTVNKPSCDDLEQTDTAGLTKPATVLGQHCLSTCR